MTGWPEWVCRDCGGEKGEDHMCPEGTVPYQPPRDFTLIDNPGGQPPSVNVETTQGNRLRPLAPKAPQSQVTRVFTVGELGWFLRFWHWLLIFLRLRPKPSSYIGQRLVVNGVARTITAYDGTTRTVTVDSPWDQPPDTVNPIVLESDGKQGGDSIQVD